MKKEAAEQAARFADQKDDPTASVYALDYLRKHTEMASEAVAWHVHDLDHKGSSARLPEDLPVSFDFSADTITREFESSLRRLRTYHVDLLQLHDVEFGSVEQIVHETLPAMRLLQEQGKARFIGITGYWPGHLVSIAKRFEVDTILNYCHGNLLIDDINEELIPFAQRQGVAVLNASPLHMGLLGGAPIPEWHPAPAEVRHTAVEIQRCCEEFGLRPAAVALAWCLAQQEVATTLVGISRVRELEDALSSLRIVVPRELLERFRQIAAPVARSTWPSGLAENQPASVLHAR